MRIATQLVHAGQATDPQTYAVIPPVYFNSTYFQDGPGHHKGFDYSRADHPNRRQLETAIATLEGGKYGLCFASGCAATAAVLGTLSPGDHVLSVDTIYGGTYRLFFEIFARWGLTFSFVSAKDSQQSIAKKIGPKTRLIWIETPSNPTLALFDIPRFVNARGKNRQCNILVDNTFATPILQNPLALGTDIVLHSTTKYLGGHSDVLGGALVLNDKSWYEKLRFYLKAAGAVPGPMDCYLVQRGIKTLAVRMRTHNENAIAIAEWLRKQNKIGSVYYPGFHPKTLTSNAMREPGGMVSFVLSRGSTTRFFKRLRIIRLAESLGGVESLICLPYSMSHACMQDWHRSRCAITPRLIRLSVGIEDKHDLIEDLAYALKGA